jgi:hypothetical protein
MDLLNIRDELIIHIVEERELHVGIHDLISISSERPFIASINFYY